jgi:hypothetical protein
MTDDVGLDKERTFCGIQSAGDVLGYQGTGSLPEFSGHIRYGDGMHIHQRKQAFVIIQKRGPLFDGTQVIANSQDTGGLRRGQYGLSGRIAHNKK